MTNAIPEDPKYYFLYYSFFRHLKLPRTWSLILLRTATILFPYTREFLESITVVFLYSNSVSTGSSIKQGKWPIFIFLHWIGYIFTSAELKPTRGRNVNLVCISSKRGVIWYIDISVSVFAGFSITRLLDAPENTTITTEWGVTKACGGDVRKHSHPPYSGSRALYPGFFIPLSLHFGINMRADFTWFWWSRIVWS